MSSHTVLVMRHLSVEYARYWGGGSEHQRVKQASISSLIVPWKDSHYEAYFSDFWIGSHIISSCITRPDTRNMIGYQDPKARRISDGSLRISL